MFDGQVMPNGAYGGFCPCVTATVAGPVTAGLQVCPPSKLTSVKISKKLSILNWPVAGSGVMLVLPSDCLLGLSRTITLGGSPPP